MRLQRVREAGSRIEKQADKWTVEGIVKSLGLTKVFNDAAPALGARSVLALCESCAAWRSKVVPQVEEFIACPWN